MVKSKLLKPLNVDNLKKQYESLGYVATTDVFDESFCAEILYRLQGKSLIKIDHVGRMGNTHFLTINGQKLTNLFPEFKRLYSDLIPTVSDVVGFEVNALDELDVGFSLNYTPAGGGFFTHFDRNSITVSIYFNPVGAGELLVWPRAMLKFLRPLGKLGRVISVLLTKIKKPVVVKPDLGTLVLFGHDTAHAVNAVVGDKARVSLILAYNKIGSESVSSDYYGRRNEHVTLHNLDI